MKGETLSWLDLHLWRLSFLDPSLLFAAGIGTSMGLFCVGAAKSLATRNGLIRGGVENLIIAGIGATFAYGVGVKFGSAVPI